MKINLTFILFIDVNISFLFNNNFLYQINCTKFLNILSYNKKIVDEIKHSTPLIYLCKINEREFLSYSITQAPSDKTEYAS